MKPLTFRLPPEPHCTAPRHHTRQAYQRSGCRCSTAREADRLYRKRRRYGLLPSGYVPAFGVTRRLQALAALGHSVETLAPLCGISANHLKRLRAGKAQTVYRTTRTRICKVYDQLSMVPGTNLYLRALARANKWAPPLAWDEGDIDNPHAFPHLPFPGRPRSHNSQRRGPSRAEVEEYKATVREYFLAGYPVAFIARETRRNEEAVRRLILRHRDEWTAETTTTAQAA